MSDVLIERQGPVTTITINRPAVHNALNAGVMGQLRDAFAAAGTDRAVRAVIVTGAGEKAFSVGADLKEIAAMNASQALRTMQAGQDVFRAIERMPVPVIAAVNGLALGGGFELALATTFPLLSQRASLGLPEGGLGLIPGYGGTQRLPRIAGPRVAAHLMLTGERLSAERAYELGLTPLPPAPPAELLAMAVKAAETICARGPGAVRSILRLLDIARTGSLDVGLTAETGMAALAIAGEESVEGIRAFLERRPPQFPDWEEPR